MASSRRPSSRRILKSALSVLATAKKKVPITTITSGYEVAGTGILCTAHPSRDTGIYIDSSANWGRWAEDGVKTGTHKASVRKSRIRPFPCGSGPMSASSPAIVRIYILPMMPSAAIPIRASSSTRASTTACGPASGIRNTMSAAIRRTASIPSMTRASMACPSATS